MFRFLAGPGVPSTLRLMDAGLSLAEWTVLALICEHPTHGFAIAQLTTPGGELGRVWHFSKPVVYRSIAHLEENVVAAQLDLTRDQLQQLASASVREGMSP